MSNPPSDKQHPEGNCLLCGGGTYTHKLDCPTERFNRIVANNIYLNKQEVAARLLRAFRDKT